MIANSIADYATSNPNLIRFEKLIPACEWNQKCFILRHKAIEETVLLFLNGILLNTEDDYDIEDNVIYMAEKVGPNEKLFAFYTKE